MRFSTFFFMNRTHLAPDKQAKRVFLNTLFFCEDIQIQSSKNSTFFDNKIYQKILVLVCIVHLRIRFCFKFFLKARRGQNIQNCSRQNSTPAQSLTPHSVSLHGVRLRAVLANFGFRDISISNCAESLISRISSRKRIFEQNHFRLFIRGSDGFD